MIEILVLYYSSGGSVKALAQYIAKGIESVNGVKAKIRTVAQLSTECDSCPTDNNLPDNHHPFATLEDLAQCDGLALGSPVRFGNMSAHLKYFLERTTPEWLTGSLIGKPACAFTSSSSMHGGQEACLLSMILPLMHHGMLIVGLPYADSRLMITKTGGTPYGVSHLAGIDNKLTTSNEEKDLAIMQGKRLAEIALRLK